MALSMHDLRARLGRNIIGTIGDAPATDLHHAFRGGTVLLRKENGLWLKLRHSIRSTKRRNLLTNVYTTTTTLAHQDGIFRKMSADRAPADIACAKTAKDVRP